jgi:hypothetical protein
MIDHLSSGVVMINQPDPQAALHKFDQPVKPPLIHRQAVELEYASQFIPFLKYLENETGIDRVLNAPQEIAFLGG